MTKTAGRARVALQPCASYDMDVVRASLAQALGALPEAAEVFARGRRILVKPNLLSSTHPPEAAVNTHPAVIRALVEYALARGARVWVGDSCGCLSEDSTARALDVGGVRALASDTGAQAVNFDRAAWVSLPVREGRVLSSVRVPKVAVDVDAVVNAPKFKTHGLTMMTGAVKNLLGLVPGKGKKDIHVQAPKPEEMSRALVDIYSVVRPALTVMDAVVGMEGEGPAGGRAREVGYLLASGDGVALDAVAGAMMGLAPHLSPTTREAAARGLGVGDLDAIDVVGATLEQARPAKWALPGGPKARSLLWRVMPRWFAAWAYEQAGHGHAVADPKLCRRCGLCERNCPAGAIAVSPEGIVVAEDRCIACYCCAEVCPHNAIVVRGSVLGRLVRGLARVVQGRGQGQV
ncbi:MAG TPA: DUF362 domain-containing protein [Candidatus Brocadiia bacterium]|nr:DUF362 domain-containing protein [Candidatus Brocadiia bacterium]